MFPIQGDSAEKDKKAEKRTPDEKVRVFSLCSTVLLPAGFPLPSHSLHTETDTPTTKFLSWKR